LGSLPRLWTLKHVDSLPNPDPSDIEALDSKPISTKDVKVDEAAEAKRPEAKRQAQEWAGIAQNPKSDCSCLSVVGRSRRVSI
jgi:alpha-1,3-glucan synthase